MKIKMVCAVLLASSSVTCLASCDTKTPSSIEEKEDELVYQELSFEGLKNEFEIGERFSKGDLKVYVIYTNGVKKEITDYELDSSAFDSSKAGQCRIYIKCLGHTKSYKVTIKGDGEDTPEIPDTPDTPDNPYEDDEDYIINFYHSMNNKMAEQLQPLVEKYNQAFSPWRINVKQIPDSNSLTSNVVEAIVDGNQPDLVYGYADSVKEFLPFGKVVDMSDYLYSNKNSYIYRNVVGYSSNQIADFYEGYLSEGYATNYSDYSDYGYTENSLLSMPFLRNQDVLYYNKDELDKLGIAVPKTWDELWQACELIKAENPDCQPLAFDSESNFISNIAKQNGFGFTSTDAPHYLFANEGLEGAFADLAIKYNQGLFTTSTLYGSYTSNLFAKGAAKGCVFSIASVASHNFYDSNSFSVGVASLPGIKLENGKVYNANLSTGPSLVMLETNSEYSSERKKMTWEFVKMLEETDNQKAFAYASGLLPVREPDALDMVAELFNEDVNSVACRTMIASYNQGKNAYSNPTIPLSASVNRAITEAFLSTIKNDQTAKEALQNALNYLPSEEVSTGIPVSSFADRFFLKEANTVVYDDFELPQEFKIGEETCEISWVSSNSHFITIENDGKLAKVHPTAPVTHVKLTAFFTYHDKTISKKFTIGVYKEKNSAENLIDWHLSYMSSYAISGYVCAKDAYSLENGTTNLYVLDDSLIGGYFVYDVKCDKDTYDNILVGTHVSVSEIENQTVNGLKETKSGATVTIDSDIQPKTESELIYPIDSEFLFNANSIYYKTSTLVSLNGWKVSEIKDAAKDASKYSSNEELLVLTKGNARLSIYGSKYLALDDTTISKLVNTCSNLQVGDYINVIGIVDYYNEDDYPFVASSYRILLTKEDSIVKNEEYTEESDAGLLSFISKIQYYAIPTKYSLKYSMYFPVESEFESYEILSNTDKYQARTVFVNQNNYINFEPDMDTEYVLIKFTVKEGSYSVVEYVIFYVGLTENDYLY